MANKSSQKRYPDELKERAVKMVLELQREDPHDHGVFSRVVRELGVGSGSLRTWVKRSEIQRSLNGRPRKTLGYMMPEEKLAELVAHTG